ncbi:MAG: glycosyltransferase family 4 protein [Chloroflexi bacterium]|nr:glycosyltransferase family 4 protein [Chloroflexota bacterium]
MLPLDVGLASALLQSGCNITWVTNEKTKLPVEGAEVWHAFSGIFGSDASYKRGIRYGVALARILRGARHIRSQMPVVIHQQFVILPVLDFMFSRLVQQSGIPYVCSPHDVIPFAPRMSDILIRFYKRCNALILNSQYAQQQMRKVVGASPTAMYHIPLGNMNGYYAKSQSDSLSARKALGIESDYRVLLFAGQVKKEKGLEYLLRTLPLVAARLSKLVLIIAGRPFHQDVELYESLIDNLGIRHLVKIRWGYVEDHELEVLHQAADAIVLPYLRVYQSAACLTAYAFSKPVVAFASGGLVEQVVNGETGYLVQTGDWHALAEAIIVTVNDREIAGKLGQNGHDWAEYTGDWHNVANKTLQVYRDALKSHKYT